MSRRRRIVLIAGGVVLFFTITLVAAIATLTQTERGLAFIMRSVQPVLSAAIPGRIYVGRVSGNLFTDIRIDSLEIRDPDGGVFVATGPLRVVYDPRDLIDRRVVVKLLEVDRPYVNLIDYGDDDWNWKRALRRPQVGPRLPERPGALGQYIVIDSIAARELTLVATLPWALSDTLRGAKRDSALTYNLTRLDSDIRRDGDRYVRDWRFTRGFAYAGKSRLADPDSAGIAFQLRRADVIWTDPPFWFRNVSGLVRIIDDSLWFDDGRLELTNSRGRGRAKIVWGSDLPVRYDVRVHGDSVSLIDIAWLDEGLPRSGWGTMDLHIRNDPRDLHVIEYAISNMDARSMQSRLRGGMTFGVGGPVLRVTDVDLDLQPAHTDLLRQFNGEPFPFNWQGELRGRILASGGPIHRFVIDAANLAYHDLHVRGAVSRAQARGMVNIYTPADAVLMGVEMRVEQLDLRTPRFVNPLFPELNGFLRGSLRVDSLWYDGRFTNAQLEHVDGPGIPSRVTGSGTYALLEQGVRFDVDLQAAPLSYTTLSRSYPSLPLRGLAVGRIRAAGMAEDFSLEALLAGEGGELAFDGRVDALEPSFRVTGAVRARGVDLQSILETSGVPQSMLTMSGTVDLSGADLGTLYGPLRLSIDQFSRIADARLFGGNIAVSFDSGAVRVDTLAIESSALRITSRGALGLTAGRSDTLGFFVAVDSLGGLRPWLASALQDSTGAVIPDTLRGGLEVRGLLSGTLDKTEVGVGLSLRARADASSVAFATSRIARSSAQVDVSDVLSGARGSVRATIDSAAIGVVDVDAGEAWLTYRAGQIAGFGTQLRTPTDATLQLAGRVDRVADTATITVDTLDVLLSTPTGRRRGFSLLAPAIARVVDDTTGRLDSLVLVHTDTGRIAVRGGIAAGGGINGRLDVDRLPLLDAGLLLRTEEFRGGYATFQTAVRGTRESPVIYGQLTLRDALVSGVRLAALDANVAYDSLRLGFGASLVVGNRRALEATGSLPMDLSLVAGRTRLLDEPISGRIITRDADLSLVEALVPTVSAATGRLTADVQLTGTWQTPRLRGSLRVDSGAMTLDNLGIRLQRANADVVLAGDSIRIRSFGATSGARGDTIGLSGLISIATPRNPFFDVQLAARNFLAIDQPRSATLALTTTRPITLYGPQDAAVVRGSVRVDRGRVYIRALTQRRGLDLADSYDVIDTIAVGVNTLLPDAPNALVQNLALDNVTVEIGDDVWLRSPEANIKLGGALRVTRSVSRERNRSLLALSDSLTVERGTYHLNLGIARPSFDVERGVIRFFGDPDLEPALDISALHTVRELRPNSNRQDVRIRVSIGGSTAQPTLTLSSADNPPLPESDMLSYLVTGEPAYALLGTPYAEQGVTLGMRLASSYLSSRLAGGRFDVVQVEPTALGPGDAANLRQNYLGILAQTRVGVGGQIARNTYFTFSTALCGLAPQSSGDPLSLFAQGLGVKVEHRFERGLSASIGVEPGSSALACGRQGISRTFQQTPPQFGFDLFRFWTF